MRFYTNVQLIGNEFLIRGYDNGDHFQIREKYSPTLFVLSQKPSKYKTLDGKYVEPIQPGYVKDCREFYKKYEDVNNFDIYGTIGSSISISQITILRMKSNLISLKSKFLRLILR